jgi:hypothetical protein
MEDFVKGWKAALRMVLHEANRMAKFNTDADGNEIFNIHDKKSLELPDTIKELDKMLWRAYRAGQACASRSTLNLPDAYDFTQFITNDDN